MNQDHSWFRSRATQAAGLVPTVGLRHDVFPVRRRPRMRHSACRPPGAGLHQQPLTERKLFCELGSDGVTIDNGGNVYLTGKGVSVFDAAGTELEQIEVPEEWTANLCFGGKDRHTLFITAGKGLYGLRMRVKGVGSQ